MGFIDCRREAWRRFSGRVTGTASIAVSILFLLPLAAWGRLPDAPLAGVRRGAGYPAKFALRWRFDERSAHAGGSSGDGLPDGNALRPGAGLLMAMNDAGGLPGGLAGQAHRPEKRKQKKKRKYSPSATTGSPGHIFWVVPAYRVNYQHKFQPLSPREKFNEWAESVVDPLGLTLGAVEAATLQNSPTDGFCGYGHGFAAYGECYGSMQLDAIDSGFIGDYVLTVLWHQDPRYFRLGHGGVFHRVLYSISRVFVTYNDSGHNTFYSSALTGTVVAAVVSNLYYPKKDRGVGPTISRIGIDLGNTELYNGAAEFWPGIHRTLKKIF